MLNAETVGVLAFVPDKDVEIVVLSLAVRYQPLERSRTVVKGYDESEVRIWQLSIDPNVPPWNAFPAR